MFELFDFSFHRGDLTCQLDDLGIGASTAAAAAIRGRRSNGVGATAAVAIRSRRSSRGGSRPGLVSLACGLVESQCGFESYDFCVITDRARTEEPAFLDIEVFPDVPGLAAAAGLPHLSMRLQVYGLE